MNLQDLALPVHPLALVNHQTLENHDCQEHPFLPLGLEDQLCLGHLEDLFCLLHQVGLWDPGHHVALVLPLDQLLL